MLQWFKRGGSGDKMKQATHGIYEIDNLVSKAISIDI